MTINFDLLGVDRVVVWWWRPNSFFSGGDRVRPFFRLHNFFDHIQPRQKWQEVKITTEILDKEFLDRTANHDLPGSNDEKAEELEDIALAIEMLAERIKSLTEGTDAESYAYRYVTGHMAANYFGIRGEGVAERIRKAARMLER